MPGNATQGYIAGSEKLVGGILRIFLPRESSDGIAGGLGDIARTATSGQGEVPTVLSDGRIEKVPPTNSAGGVATIDADGKTIFVPPSAEQKKG